MKIKLTIAGKVVELTVDEAKALFAELAKAFGAQPLIIERQAPFPYPVPVPYHPPTFIDPQVPHWGTPIVTCRAESAA